MLKLVYVVINSSSEFPLGLIVKAEPMDSQKWAILNGSDIMIEDPVDGFIIYVDSRVRTWIDEQSFNKIFKLIKKDDKVEKVENLTIGEAIEAMENGHKVCREGWNGKGMFLFLVPGSTFKVNRAPLLGIYPEGTEITYQPHIDMKTAQNTVVPWLASQSDILAKDWMIVQC